MAVLINSKEVRQAGMAAGFVLEPDKDHIPIWQRGHLHGSTTSHKMRQAGAGQDKQGRGKAGQGNSQDMTPHDLPGHCIAPLQTEESLNLLNGFSVHVVSDLEL